MLKLKGLSAEAFIIDDVDFRPANREPLPEKPPALCSQCSKGKKSWFEGKCSKKDSDAGNYLFICCDGCGITFVDYLGRCVDPDCKTHGKDVPADLLVRDVAKLTGTHKATVVRAIQKKELKAVRNSFGYYMVKTLDAKNWANKREQG